MKELIQQIQKLLLENDCVIIPDFGGFVAHYSSAKWIEEEGLFLPPTRVIGFNSQLKLNDGLLAQAYMDTYGTDFADATKLVNKAVNELKNFLHLNGYIDMHGIGEMTQNIQNHYTFRPYTDGAMTPSLYALTSFHIQKLSEEAYTTSKSNFAEEKNNSKESDLILESDDEETENDYRFSPKVYLISSIIAAAVILFFFLFSTKIYNTELSKVNVAQIIPSGSFYNADKTSLIAKKTEVSKKNYANNHKAFVQNKDSIKDKYFIIISAVANRIDAKSITKHLRKEGNNKSCVIPGKRSFRIAITSFNDRAIASKELAKFRSSATYKSAWLLIKK